MKKPDKKLGWVSLSVWVMAIVLTVISFSPPVHAVISYQTCGDEEYRSNNDHTRIYKTLPNSATEYDLGSGYINNFYCICGDAYFRKQFNVDSIVKSPHRSTQAFAFGSCYVAGVSECYGAAYFVSVLANGQLSNSVYKSPYESTSKTYIGEGYFNTFICANSGQNGWWQRMWGVAGYCKSVGSEVTLATCGFSSMPASTPSVCPPCNPFTCLDYPGQCGTFSNDCSGTITCPCTCDGTISSCGVYPTCATCAANCVGIIRNYNPSCTGNVCTYSTETCAPSECTAFGPPTCLPGNGGFTRSRTCYTAGCTPSQCTNTPYTDIQTTNCNPGYTCSDGTCVPLTYTLRVDKDGSGTGIVTSSPSGIDCGPACQTASHDFNSGIGVALTKDPSTDSVFQGWSGACMELGGCSLTMTGAKQVTATFDLIPGACGPAEKVYTYAEDFPDGSLCSFGVATTPVPSDPEQGDWSRWACTTGGGTDQCEAYRETPKECSCTYIKDYAHWSACIAGVKFADGPPIEETLVGTEPNCPHCPDDAINPKPCSEICDDPLNEDEDEDGAVNCLDTDCCGSGLGNCLTMTDEGAYSFMCCANLVSDDNDALIDMADPDCIPKCFDYADWVTADVSHDTCDVTALDSNPPFTTCVRNSNALPGYNQQCNKTIQEIIPIDIELDNATQ